jgi:hypothetical protein
MAMTSAGDSATGIRQNEDGRVQLLVRVPLVLLSNFSLPKRGPAIWTSANVDPKLKLAAAAIGHLIEVRADGTTLVPTTREVRLSLLSDRSFASYSNALAHLQGPPLPAGTDLFWNQGYFDMVRIATPITHRIFGYAST